MIDCLFCKLDKERIINENSHSLIFLDKFPVSEGHALVIPKRHVSDWFDLTSTELTWMHHLAQKYKDTVECDGWNIGVNIGEHAGQTVFHVHMHLIPRYIGDVKNPRGGFRHIIPGKGYYTDEPETVR
jgi:diadenosine tetraphosphate (Ap4A) HIT family hydrolase